jgi:hypothetical protein
MTNTRPIMTHHNYKASNNTLLAYNDETRKASSIFSSDVCAVLPSSLQSSKATFLTEIHRRRAECPQMQVQYMTKQERYFLLQEELALSGRSKPPATTPVLARAA